MAFSLSSTSKVNDHLLQNKNRTKTNDAVNLNVDSCGKSATSLFLQESHVRDLWRGIRSHSCILSPFDSSVNQY